jgi:VanZ family protein
MHMPVAGGATPAIPHVDKLLHFGLYFMLTWLGGRHLLAMGPRSPLATLIVWAVIYAAYAAADESLQPLVGRTMSFVDWLGDLAGIVASTVVLALKCHRRPTSKPPDSSL